MPREVQIHIGDALDVMGARFVDAWHRAEHGELAPDSLERHTGFASF